MLSFVKLSKYSLITFLFMNSKLYFIFLVARIFIMKFRPGQFRPRKIALAGKRWIFYKIMITNFIQIFFFSLNLIFFNLNSFPLF